MDVVRVPVVLGAGAKVAVLDADFLVLLFGPTQFLVNVAGGDQGTIGVVDLFPIQRYGAEFLDFGGSQSRHDFDPLSCVVLISVDKFVAYRLLFRFIEVLKPIFLANDPELHYWAFSCAFEQFEQMHEALRPKLLPQLLGVVPLLQILKPLAVVRLPIDLGERTTASLRRRSQHRPQRPEQFWTFVRPCNESYQ